MSTTPHFFASGAGNGFTTCLVKVDVSDSGYGDPYDFWVTLGGYKKTDAAVPTAVTQAQIDTSFRNAYRMFWMMYKVTGVASVATINITEAVADAEDTAGSRVCKSFSGFAAYGELEPYPTEPDDYMQRRARLQGYAKIVRMYNGVTTDESNFIGYGVSFGPSAFAAYSIEGSGLTLQTGSYMDELGLLMPVDYAHLSGIPLVCEAFDGTPDSTGRTLTPGSLTATVTGDDYELVTTLATMEFYTHP